MLRKCKLVKVYFYSSFEKTEDEIFELFQKESSFSEWQEYFIVYDIENKCYIVNKILRS